MFIGLKRLATDELVEVGQVWREAEYETDTENVTEVVVTLVDGDWIEFRTLLAKGKKPVFSDNITRLARGTFRAGYYNTGWEHR